jgi:hypothetical protein
MVDKQIIMCYTALVCKQRIYPNGHHIGDRKETDMNKTTVMKLRQEYPTHIPLRVAAPLLGISERRLSALIAEGRKPFSDIGANIGVWQKYARIYTERMIAYLKGEKFSREEV